MIYGGNRNLRIFIGFSWFCKGEEVMGERTVSGREDQNAGLSLRFLLFFGMQTQLGDPIVATMIFLEKTESVRGSFASI